MDIKQLIGEATDYDKKVALETKKPKSWCKSISAFANCYGGKLVFGVANDDELVGLPDAKGDSDYHNFHHFHEVPILSTAKVSPEHFHFLYA